MLRRFSDWRGRVTSARHRHTYSNRRCHHHRPRDTYPTAIKSPAPSPTPAPPPTATPTSIATSTLPPSFPFGAGLADAALGYVTALVEELGPRESATEEELEAAEYLASAMENFGYAVKLQPFTVRQVSRELSSLEIDGRVH